MCGCSDTLVCGYHFEQIEELYLLLREAEQHNTGLQEPLRLALAEYGRKTDMVILAIEAREVA